MDKKQWYLDIADREYGEYDDSWTYGPFNSEKDVERYLNNFSNPGGWQTDASGKEKPPTRSPNGRSVTKPR